MEPNVTQMWPTYFKTLSFFSMLLFSIRFPYSFPVSIVLDSRLKVNDECITKMVLSIFSSMILLDMFGKKQKRNRK